MLCADVNVLVNAHRREAAAHEAFRAWLVDAANGHEPLGLSDVVLAGFVRIVTHPRVFAEPTSTALAFEFVSALFACPASVRIEPGDRHWDLFGDLCRRVEAKGNAVPDAYLAALAIEQGAEWITADRGFARFPGLRWRHPLDDA